MAASPKFQRALEQAVEAYRDRDFELADAFLLKAAEEDRDNPDMLYLRSLIALDSGLNEAAVELLELALRRAPTNPGFHVNLGEAYRKLGRFEEATVAYRAALELSPNMVEATFNLGLALEGLGRLDEAIACLERAASLRPGLPQIQKRLAYALKEAGRLDEAIERLIGIVKATPNDPAAHNNLGVLAKDAGDLEGSIPCFQKALAIHPDFIEAHSNLLYSLSFHPGYGASQILEEARRFQRRHAGGIAPLAPLEVAGDGPDRKLRIGYVSPDFRDHCQALFMVPLLTHHDRKRFEIFCYSNVRNADAVTARIQGLVPNFREIHSLSEQAAAEMIRDDRIDILVDLTMHMSHSRPLIFAHKPAPVQVAWLAYPGTTGLSTIDYRITDPFLDPPDEPEQPYTEKSIRLPETFWCYDPLSAEVGVGPLPADGLNGVTFGCLNNFCKVNDAVLELWSRVLKNVENSRLLLLVQSKSARERTLQRLATQGVANERVSFVEYRPRDEYLAFYRKIDVCLDTFPYNGHTTSLDAFWMGVPVVTLVGPTVVGRAGLCQAMNLALPELVARNHDDYVRIASGLAADLPKLRELRGSLRARMTASPLMDAPRFAKNLEEAYLTMWQVARSQPPAE